jgi:hypothetical protein
MPKNPGSLRKKPKKPTFVVTKKGDPKHNDAFVPPIENVPNSVEEYTKVVYCNALDCVFNQSVDELVHTESEVKRGNHKHSSWKPLSPQMEKVWKSVCTRNEVVIDIKTQVGPSGSKTRVPGCHTPWELGRSGHVDFSKRMGESFSIDDSQDPTARDEGWVMDNSPFQN